MKAEKVKHDFIRLRAEGKSYDAIAKELNISKSTCTAWNKSLEREIATAKKEELEALYTTFHMKKESRIKRIGQTLEGIESAIASADLTEIAPERLLELKLKYIEALQAEYTPTEGAKGITGRGKDKGVLKALQSLLSRIQSGEVSEEQARQEMAVLDSYLKAYETVEVKKRLDELESIVAEERGKR